MEPNLADGPLIARCIVCRGDIHEAEPHEIWEGGYYCERHSVPWLRARAREYAELLQVQNATVRQQDD